MILKLTSCIIRDHTLACINAPIMYVPTNITQVNKKVCAQNIESEDAWPLEAFDIFLF